MPPELLNQTASEQSTESEEATESEQGAANEGGGRSFDQSDVDRIVQGALAKQARSFQRQLAKKESETPPASTTEESGPSLEAIMKMVQKLGQTVDERFSATDFDKAAARYQLAPEAKEILEAAWKGKGKPDLDDFLGSATGVFKPSGQPTEASAKAPAPTGKLPGATVDGGAPSAIRDGASITNPGDLTNDDMRRLPIKKVREIVEGHFDSKSNTLPRLFPKRQ